MNMHRAYIAVCRTLVSIVAAICLLRQSGPVLAENIPEKVMRLEIETGRERNEITRLHEEVTELNREVSTLRDILATLRNGTIPQRGVAGKFLAFGHAAGAGPVIARASTEDEAKATVANECALKSIKCKIEIVDTSLNPHGCDAISFSPHSDELYWSYGDANMSSSDRALNLCKSRKDNDCLIVFHYC
jgi:hypothetical protein